MGLPGVQNEESDCFVPNVYGIFRQYSLVIKEFIS